MRVPGQWPRSWGAPDLFITHIRIQARAHVCVLRVFFPFPHLLFLHWGDFRGISMVTFAIKFVKSTAVFASRSSVLQFPLLLHKITKLSSRKLVFPGRKRRETNSWRDPRERHRVSTTPRRTCESNRFESVLEPDRSPRHATRKTVVRNVDSIVEIRRGRLSLSRSPSHDKFTARWIASRKAYPNLSQSIRLHSIRTDATGWLTRWVVNTASSEDKGRLLRAMRSKCQCSCGWQRGSGVRGNTPEPRRAPPDTTLTWRRVKRYRILCCIQDYRSERVDREIIQYNQLERYGSLR